MPECGSSCEVFSRIVGYFRPVKNWNNGKREEYKFRKNFSQDKALVKDFSGIKSESSCSCKE